MAKGGKQRDGMTKEEIGHSPEENGGFGLYVEDRGCSVVGSVGYATGLEGVVC